MDGLGFDRPYLSWQSDGAKFGWDWAGLDWTVEEAQRKQERKKERKSIVDSLIPAHFAEKLTTTDTF